MAGSNGPRTFVPWYGSNRQNAMRPAQFLNGLELVGVGFAGGMGDLEQLVEQHVRLAHKAIARFKLRGGSPATAKTAAGHIFRATVYRSTYLATMQVDDPPVSEFPFPLLTIDEAQRINRINTEIDQDKKGEA